MTGMEITYQDGLRLSELYGQMSTIKYDLAHLATSSLIYTILICALMTLVYYLIVDNALNNIKVDVFHYGLRYGEETKKPYYWGNKGQQAFGYLCIGAVILLIVLYVLVYLGVMELMEFYLNRDIANIQAQIDAILSKYEQGGI